MSEATPRGALAGIRVLDLSRLLPGPYATMLLADLGADVVKVEQPGIGDAGRYQSFGTEGEPRSSFEILNRGKRSITLDLKSAAGKQVLAALVARSDVLVESFRPGVMERLGFGYAELSERHPGLVYCSISGYGASGPMRERPGHDINYLGRAGVLDMTGAGDGPPALIGPQLADLGGGALPASVGILAALVARSATGRGQHVEVGMANASLTLNLLNWAEQLDHPDRAVRRGATTLTGRYACYHVYRCADGRHVTLGALEGKFWRRFCERVQRPDWTERQFEEDDARREALIGEVAELFSAHASSVWLEQLEDDEICLGPVHTVAEAMADPQFVATGAVYEAPSSSGRPLVQPQAGFLLSDTPTAHRAPAPRLGEHTREVLAELGYDPDAIEALERDGAI